MRIDIVTLFPEICRAPLSESIMKRAQENRIIELHIHNLRDWTTDKHHVVDDAPFGGGQGMVMKSEPIFAAVEELKSQIARNAREAAAGLSNRKSQILLMSPAGVGSINRWRAAVTRAASHNHFRTLRRSRSSRDRTSD
jgi:tRNA-(guanine-N1)-methyltransferase